MAAWAAYIGLEGVMGFENKCAAAVFCIAGMRDTVSQLSKLTRICDP